MKIDIDKERRRQLNRAEHRQAHAQRDVELNTKGARVKIRKVPQSNPEFLARAKESMSRLLDTDNVAATIFTLKSLGASEGWIEGGNQEAVDVSKMTQLSEFFRSVDKASQSSPSPISDVREDLG